MLTTRGGHADSASAAAAPGGHAVSRISSACLLLTTGPMVACELAPEGCRARAQRLDPRVTSEGPPTLRVATRRDCLPRHKGLIRVGAAAHRRLRWRALQPSVLLTYLLYRPSSVVWLRIRRSRS